MKKLFLFLLKMYSHTEEERIEIHKILNDQVSNRYREQTSFGNVYNSNIEFIMSNDTIRRLIENNEVEYLKMIEGGLHSSIKDAFQYIKNEPRKLKLQKLNGKSNI